MQLLWENFQFVIILKESLDSRIYAHTHTQAPLRERMDNGQHHRDLQGP